MSKSKKPPKREKADKTKLGKWLEQHGHKKADVASFSVKSAKDGVVELHKFEKAKEKENKK